METAHPWQTSRNQTSRKTSQQLTHEDVGLEQLPDLLIYRGHSDPPELNYGIAFPMEALTNYAIEKGFWKPDEEPEEEYEDEEEEHDLKLIAYSSALSEARYHLTKTIGMKSRYPSVHCDIPVAPGPPLEMLAFYTNYTPPEERYPDHVEKKVVETLRQELKLPNTKPRWYYQYAYH
jgi:hypothetical protein